jgi:hypothetical protein
MELALSGAVAGPVSATARGGVEGALVLGIQPADHRRADPVGQPGRFAEAGRATPEARLIAADTVGRARTAGAFVGRGARLARRLPDPAASVQALRAARTIRRHGARRGAASGRAGVLAARGRGPVLAPPPSVADAGGHEGDRVQAARRRARKPARPFAAGARAVALAVVAAAVTRAVVGAFVVRIEARLDGSAHPILTAGEKSGARRAHAAAAAGAANAVAAGARRAIHVGSAAPRDRSIHRRVRAPARGTVPAAAGGEHHRHRDDPQHRTRRRQAMIVRFSRRGGQGMAFDLCGDAAGAPRFS